MKNLIELWFSETSKKYYDMIKSSRVDDRGNVGKYFEKTVELGKNTNIYDKTNLHEEMVLWSSLKSQTWTIFNHLISGFYNIILGVFTQVVSHSHKFPSKIVLI